VHSASALLIAAQTVDSGRRHRPAENGGFSFFWPYLLAVW